MSKRVSARRVAPPKPELALPTCGDCPIGGRESGSGPVCPRAHICDQECAEQLEAMEDEGREWRRTLADPPPREARTQELSNRLMRERALNRIAQAVPPAVTEATVDRLKHLRMPPIGDNYPRFRGGDSNNDR